MIYDAFIDSVVESHTHVYKLYDINIPIGIDVRVTKLLPGLLLFNKNSIEDLLLRKTYSRIKEFNVNNNGNVCDTIPYMSTDPHIRLKFSCFVEL